MRPRSTYGRSGDSYHYDQDEILHRDGDWCIRKSNGDADWRSYIHHRMKRTILQQNRWDNGQPPEPLTHMKEIGCEWSDLPVSHNQCTSCYNTIPEGLMGLWVMHNWDALQKHAGTRWV